MKRPFVPFPIFPPYTHWHPNQVPDFPSNLQVIDCLNDVSQSSHPFISTWYVNQFINWIAHSWNPINSQLHYSSCINGLEKMLNWSFANDRCLLDWTRSDFESYSEFIRSPPPDWTSAGKQSRFLGRPSKDFREWRINPTWMIFQGNRPAGSREFAKKVWEREIRCVSQFMDFYLKTVSTNRENVASERLKFLTFKTSEPLAPVSDEVFNWILKTLPTLDLSTHDVQLLSMYLMIARHSARPMWHVLGTASSPGRVEQFTRSDQGIWQETNPKNGKLVSLSIAFGQAFERYLFYLNIDSKQPLPDSNLFPRGYSLGAFSLTALWRMICSIRGRLADIAMTSDNPDIANEAQNIRRLTAVMISIRKFSKS